MSKVFHTVPVARTGRSVFDLSYSKRFSANMQNLYIAMADEMVPGDVFQMGVDATVRCMPLTRPFFTELYLYAHYFFVPYRLLMSVDDFGDSGDWEDFITGGEDGMDASTPPTWNPASASEYALDTIWESLGWGQADPGSSLPPSRMPLRAYNTIWNEYYRDEWIDSEVDPDAQYSLLKRRWTKDYFTSCLPDPQKGPVAAMELSGTIGVDWPAVDGTTGKSAIEHQISSLDPANAASKSALEKGTVDMSSAGTFDVADLRLQFALQKWMEINARAGSRYQESLRGHFGVSARDMRLQRPEFCGGIRTPIVKSEVLQTGESGTTAQGNMAGHALAVVRDFVGKYRAEEHGIMMALVSIMPEPEYYQGINRQWLRETKEDFYWPEFANLSEQPVYQGEIYLGSSGNDTIFGYQGRYDEMRVKQNLVAGQLRPDEAYDDWTLARKFASAPLLNTSFLEGDASARAWASTADDLFVINWGNKIRAVRPLPYMAEPGLRI